MRSSTQPFSSTKPEAKILDNSGESTDWLVCRSAKNRRMFWFVFMTLMVPYVGVPGEAEDEERLAKGQL
jgi:hypothetical protein